VDVCGNCGKLKLESDKPLTRKQLAVRLLHRDFHNEQEGGLDAKIRSDANEASAARSSRPTRQRVRQSNDAKRRSGTDYETSLRVGREEETALHDLAGRIKTVQEVIAEFQRECGNRIWFKSDIAAGPTQLSPPAPSRSGLANDPSEKRIA